MARCVHGYDSVAGTRLGIDDTSGTSLFAYDGDSDRGNKFLRRCRGPVYADAKH